MSLQALRGAALGLIAFLLPASGLGEGEEPTRCGAVITQHLTLTRHLTCSRNGLTVTRDGVVVDLGGKTIRGPGLGAWTWPEPQLSSIGIRVTAKGVVVRNGRVENFGTAIFLDGVRGARLEGVQADQSFYGIYLKDSHGTVVAGSTVRENVYGLHIAQSHDNRVEENTISRSYYRSPGGYGVFMVQSTGNLIRRNRIVGNANQGLWLVDCRDNRIYHNTIAGNSPNALDDTGVGLWYSPELKQGNFWDDYRGQDADGDGIGDTPYRLSGSGEDPYPRMRPDGWQR
ncbi:MAG: right-handed parallel beta-helix repeat-containing protein [Candidatus Rokubacteria bacterium]|nr:right-handed parallel beta-helix repeat-containing protein [Candidatus Rokubacteria bacterium]